MPRNLDRRVEILFPVDDPRLRQAIVQDILHIHFQDNVQARRLQPDGHAGLRPPPNTEGISAQDWLLQHATRRVAGPVKPDQTRPEGADTPRAFCRARDSHDSHVLCHLCPAAMATACRGKNTVDQCRSADGSLHGHWHQLDPPVVGASVSEPFIHILTELNRSYVGERRVCPPARSQQPWSGLCWWPRSLPNWHAPTRQMKSS